MLLSGNCSAYARQVHLLQLGTCNKAVDGCRVHHHYGNHATTERHIGFSCSQQRAALTISTPRSAAVTRAKRSCIF